MDFPWTYHCVVVEGRVEEGRAVVRARGGGTKAEASLVQDDRRRIHEPASQDKRAMVFATETRPWEHYRQEGIVRKQM